MDCTEAYKEHIMYSFNGFCKVVIRYAAINAWRDRNRRRQREISFEYLTEEKFYPLSTSDEYLKSPYEQYPVTICGQTIILTNGELAAALLSLPEKKREIIYLYFFGNYTQQEIGDLYGHCKSTAWHYIRPVITVSPVNDELLSAVGKLTAEYGKIGGNLNQIARCLNEYGAPYNALSQEVRAAIAELAALKFEVLQKVGEAIGNVQTYQL